MRRSTEVGNIARSGTNIALSGIGLSLAVPNRSTRRAVPLNRPIIWFCFLSMMFGTQLAFNIGTFPASLDFFCYGVAFVIFASSRFCRIDYLGLVLFASMSITILLGLIVGSGSRSVASAALLLTLFFPFLFYLRDSPPTRSIHAYVANTFVMVASAIAAIAIVQFVLVNLLGFIQLTNIAFVLPEEIRSAGTYAHAREDGGIIKANGFFLKEASSLSLITALAFVVEYYSRMRWRYILILATGLLVSLSGTGVFILLAAAIVATSWRSLKMLFVIAVATLVLSTVPSHVFDLNAWTERLEEFNVEGTSGYARFVAPFEMVGGWASSGATELLLGNGAGSYLRSVNVLTSIYEINDPTWARSLYEYGLLGSTCLLLLLTRRIFASRLRLPLCVALLYTALFTGGQILKPEFTMLAWLFTVSRQSN